MALRHVQTSPKGRNLVGTQHQSKENPKGSAVDVEQKNRVRSFCQCGFLSEDERINRKVALYKDKASQTEADMLMQHLAFNDVGVQTEPNITDCSVNTVLTLRDLAEALSEGGEGMSADTLPTLRYWKQLAKENEERAKQICKDNAHLTDCMQLSLLNSGCLLVGKLGMDDGTPKSDAEGPYCICQSYEDDRFMISCDNCDNWFHGDCVNITQRQAKKVIKFYCPPCRDSQPSLKIVYRTPKQPPTELLSKQVKGCAQCIGCFRTEDCGRCDMCTAVPRTHVCRLRVCVNSLKGTPDKEQQKDEAESSTTCDEKTSGEAERCDECIGCFQSKDCGRCDICTAVPKDCQCRIVIPRIIRRLKDPPESWAAKIKPSSQEDAQAQPKEHRISKKRKRDEPRTAKSLLRESENAISSDSMLPTSFATRAGSRKYIEFMKEAGVIQNVPFDDSSLSKPLRQCLGLQCTNAARRDSMYCSNECGVKLAMERLHAILPARISVILKNRQTVVRKAEMKLQELARTRHETERRLEELDFQQKRMEEWLSNASELACASPEKESRETETDEGEVTIFCPVCGLEVSNRVLQKHMFKCSSKIESRVSYGTTSPSHNTKYNILCDSFNKYNKTYCKRLRLICPEHSKSEKIADGIVCGWPLDLDFTFNSFSKSNVCLVAKKKCLKHWQWDRYQFAMIDMERLSLILRLDEINDMERRINVRLLSAGNIMDLMLNATNVHEE
ncbi:PHD-finger [Trichuris suis]|nr:PHD-finger [Trichuris suis]